LAEPRVWVVGRRVVGFAGKAPQRDHERRRMERDRGGIGGISLGGILVIVGIVLMIFVSFWIGLIVALIGLIAFGGFAKGKWY
jgi:hypothetical protein